MTDFPDGPELSPQEAPPPRRAPRDPAATLTSALVVYIFVTLIFALPLVIFPAAFFDVIGFSGDVADELGGLRWVGAMLLAWAITGIIVLASPTGRSVFVTAGALQLTLAGVALLYSWSISEYGWHTWYQALATIVLLAAAGYLWWARLRGRKVFRGETE